jgi:hypothetical protein
MISEKELAYNESIELWIKDRVKKNETTTVRFYISPKTITNIFGNELMQKIEEKFKKIGVNCSVVDTVEGSFNLNRDYLETDKFEAIVEYCGVYPVKMDTKDSAWLSELDNMGEIRIVVMVYKDGKEYMNI